MIHSPLKPGWHYLDRTIPHEIGADFKGAIASLQTHLSGLKNARDARWIMKVIDRHGIIKEQRQSTEPYLPQELPPGGKTIYTLWWVQHYK